MTPKLQSIPDKYQTLPLEDTAVIDHYTDALRKGRRYLPFSNTMYIVYSLTRNPSDAMFMLFKQLDNIMLNIGINEENYTEQYFITQNKKIDNIVLEQHMFEKTHTIASTRIFIDKEFSNLDTILYNPENFKELKTINLHLQETNRHLVRVFKNENSLLVLTNKITWKMIFKIKALNCKLFEEQFYTYNQDVEKIYTALATGDLDEFNKRIHKILNYKTWFKYKRKSLIDCFQNKKEIRLNEKKRSIDDKTRDVINAERKYKDRLTELQKLKEDYNTILNSEDKIDVDEILDYIENHRCIKDIKKSDTTVLELTIEAPLIYFDTDVVEDYRGYPSPGMRFVMEEVFLKKKYKLWAQSKILLNTSNFYTEPLRISPVSNMFMPHPHLSRYTCQGNHPAEIRKWIETYDYIGCIEQIMVMVYNLNWTDGIVINTMFSTINSIKNCKTFEVVETGEFVSYNDIIATMEEN